MFGTAQFRFVAARLVDPDSTLLVKEVAVLRGACALARIHWPFEIDTAAVLPAEILMIWKLPLGDHAVGERWRFIRSCFAGQMGKGTARLWAADLQDRPIRDSEDLTLYRHYCVTAPIRARLVRRASDWPHSSAYRRAGRVSAADSRGLDRKAIAARA